MNAILLKDLTFEDLAGVSKILFKGTSVHIDEFDETLVILPIGELDYIIKVERADYRKCREWN